MSVSSYPKSPTNLPKNLTALPSSYQFRALMAILSVFLFFVLYAALVVALAYLVYYAVIYDMVHVNKLTGLMKLGAIAGSVMLFVFTLKFLFKLKNHKPENRIKIKKEDHPKIWEFVLKICDETGAPKPKNIWVDPDVNAYVAYSNSWLSLILPVRKELTIGMGLIGGLNNQEFKAVISHEFGHFAQRSMKIGSYIMSANTIIHDMIYSRDSWDELLDQWRASDIRLSAAAWAITPLIWIIRQVLALFYQFLNLMYSSLSREMEFNADKVAASTSGSEAIVSSLWKLDSAFENWNATMNHAFLAAKKQTYVENLYYHFTEALKRNETSIQAKIDALPTDDNGNKTYFQTSANSKVGMYASHPPNAARETNAKSPFIPCETDTRSPWMYFDKAEELQVEMTKLIYDKYLDKQPNSFIANEKFEAFIRSESEGKELLAEYGNAFENRFIIVDETSKLLTEADNYTSYDHTYQEVLKKEHDLLMVPVLAIENLMLKAQQIAEGTSTEKTIEFQEKTYNKGDMEEAYQILHTEREKLFNENFKEWDTKFCAYHLSLAVKTGEKEQLVKLYEQHRFLVEFYKKVVQSKTMILGQLHQLQTKGEVSNGDITQFKDTINGFLSDFNKKLEQFKSFHFVPLPNLDTMAELKDAIVEGQKFKFESGNIFENGGFDRALHTIESTIYNCHRVEQKNLAMMLKKHKTLHTPASVEA